MSPLSRPLSRLEGFPSRTLERGSRLYRVHRAAHGPWWFSSDGSGRFDLPDESERGTCYLAEEQPGCFLEVFRDWTLVPEKEVASRRICEIEVSADTRLADCTASRARELGLTAEIHSTPDYDVTRAWAEAFFRVGFAGIRYFLRHDPGQMLAGVALFGVAGNTESDLAKTRSSHRIEREVIDEVGRRFGIRVLPSP
ncbi:MAG: RES family NAD+ phosphorylase [bacterium]|nr:RES family NAD+ phosphorylase [bacterium]